MRTNARSTALALLLCLAAASAARGQTWSGGGADGLWNNTANWAGGAVPTSSTTTDITFNNGINLTTVLDMLQGSGGGAFDIRSLTYGATSGAFSINPTATNVTSLRIGTGGIAVQTNANQSIVAPVVIGAGQTWANTGSGRLTVTGPVTATGQTLTLGGTGAITIGGSVTGGTVVKDNTSTVVLTGDNTFGSLAVNAGTVIVGRTGAANPLGGSGSVTLNGGTLAFRVNADPLDLTGFNHDVITSVSDFPTAAATGYGTSRAVDGANGSGGFVYYEQGVNGGVPTSGLPVGGRFTSALNPSTTYQLQPYGIGGVVANNVLSLGGGASGTLTLANPGSFRTLSFANVTGSGSSTYTATLNFSDGSSTNFTNLASADWFNAANPVLIVNGRVNRGNGGFDSAAAPPGTNPRIYANDVILSAADQAKTLNSITFLPTTGGTFNLFAVSAAVPVPAQTYTTPVIVTANSTISQANVPGVTLGPLTIGTNTLIYSGDAGRTLTLGATTLTGNPTLQIDANGTATLGAVDGGAAARTITKTGAGTLALSAAGTNLGAGTVVNVNAGTATVAAGAIGTQAALTVASGATVNASAASLTVASLAGAGIVNPGTNTLTVSGGAASTFGGTIPSGTLVVSGASTALTLSGANTPAGVQVTSSGRVQLNTPFVIGSSPVTLGANATLALGGVPGLTANVVGFGGAGTGWTAVRNNAADETGITTPSSTAGGGAGGSDSLQITSALGSQARAFWRNAAVPVGAPFTVNFNYAQNQLAGGADGITFTIQSRGTANVVGAGGGAMGYTGTSLLPDGVTNSTPVTNSAAFVLNIFGTGGVSAGSNGTSTTNLSGGTLAATGISFANSALTPIAVTLTYNGSQLQARLVQGATTYNSPLITVPYLGLVGSQGFIGFTGATGGVFTGQFIDGFTYSSLNPAVAYTAPITVSDGATATLALRTVAAATGLTGVGTTANPFVIPSATVGVGSTLRVAADTGTATDLAYGLTISSAAAAAGGTGNIQVDNNGTGVGTVTVSALAGTGNLNKSGAGLMILPNASTAYAGTVSVSAGILRVTNPNTAATSATGAGNVTVNGGFLEGTGRIGGPVIVNSTGTVRGALTLASTATVNNGGVLTGNGTVVGAVQVNTGGVLRAGDGTAANRTLTAQGGLTVNGGGILRATVFGTGATDNNLVAVTGNVAADAAALLQLDLSGVNVGALRTAVGGFGGTRVYTVASATGTVTNFAGIDVAGSNYNGFDVAEWALLPSATAVQLQFTAVPEPTALLAVAAGLLGLGRAARRVRRTEPVVAA